MFLLLVIGAASVEYSLSANVLVISGTGEISQTGVRSKGNFKEIIEVKINDGPSVISYNAFFDCIKLKNVLISKTIIEIKTNVFSRCRVLDSITVESANQHYCCSSNCLMNYEKTMLVRALTIKNIEIPDGIEVICNGAFGTERNFNYGDIVLPGSVSTLQENAFNEALFDSLKFRSVSSLTEIGTFTWMFVGTLTIPNSVETIKAYAFQYSRIGTLIFESVSRLITINQNAFLSATISSIDIPDSCQTISDAAFSKSKITQITIGSSCSSISESAFAGCSNLVKIDISEQNNYYSSINDIIMDKSKTQILFIPSSKATLDIPSTVTSIGKTLLQSAAQLTEVSLESNDVWATENGILYSADFKTMIAVCGGIEEAVSNVNVEAVSEYAAYGIIKLSSISFERTNLNTIGSYAFAGSGITSFKLPSSVEKISEYAFSSCSKLSSFDISTDSQLNKIGSYAFRYSCISSFYFPSKIEIISSNTFQSCHNLKKISFAQNSILSNIGSYAFCDSGIEAITFPDSVQVINYNAFYKTLLEEVIFNSNSQLKRIDYDAFSACYNLCKVVLPDSCESIGISSFACDYKLVVFEHSLIKIGNSAFANCMSLTYFRFSYRQTQENIDSSIFQGCTNLQEFIVNESNTNLKSAYGSVFTFNGETLVLFPPGKESAIIVNTTIRFADNAFAFSTVLKSVFFMSGSMLESFGIGSFYNCTSLSSIHFPPRLTVIKEKCFMGCTSLKSINLPDSLSQIESSAFAECPALKYVKYCGTNKIDGTGVFTNSLTIRVTDIYPYDTFCSYKVSKSLKSDCELKQQFAKSCVIKGKRAVSSIVFNIKVN